MYDVEYVIPKLYMNVICASWKRCNIEELPPCLLMPIWSLFCFTYGRQRERKGHQSSSGCRECLPEPKPWGPHLTSGPPSRHDTNNNSCIMLYSYR